MPSNYTEKKETSLYTVAFYNLENLFDIYDDPNTLDDEFLPEAEKRWTQKRYQNKIFKLGTAISNIGFQSTGRPPALVGIAEVENRQVVEDLIQTRHLKHKEYGIIHFDSPDERGIDVACLYSKKYFELIEAEPVTLYLYTPEGERDYTRDILKICGKLNGERIHVLVNHWPSRRRGTNETAYRRIAAAQKNRELIQQIRDKEANAKIIIMGDFNDDPSCESVREHLVQDDLFNPMEQLHTRYGGSLSHRSEWNLFDQIIFSANFHRYQDQTHSFSEAAIFDTELLKTYKGRFKGTPFRTYAGRKYLGGYSDHFPVYINLKLNSKS